MMNSEGLHVTYDDVAIVPRYSEVMSRSDVSLRTSFTRHFTIDVPIVASPMTTVCELALAHAMLVEGGVGVIHRYMSVEDQKDQIRFLSSSISPNGVTAAAIGVDEPIESRIIPLLDVGTSVLVIDVAHGHHVKVKNLMAELLKLKSQYTFDVVVGSLTTVQAAEDAEEWGADAIRVGVSSGASCETRIRTGVGMPMMSAILNIVEHSDITIPIIADGGIRTPGDVCKCLAAGASSVMIGSLFAACEEAPGERITVGGWGNQSVKKLYAGMASASTKAMAGRPVKNVEGASKIIDVTTTVHDLMNALKDGITSACSYVNATTIWDLWYKSELIRVSSAGHQEGTPHLLR